MLILVLMLFLPVPTGLMYTCLLEKKGKVRFIDNYLLGVFTIFLTVQAACCACVKLDRDFDYLEKICIVAVLLLAVTGIILGRKGIRGYVRYIQNFGRPEEGVTETGTISLIAHPGSERRTVILWVLIVILFVLQYVGTVVFIPYTGSDVTLETIYVTRASRQLFQFNPVTGARLVNGVYPIYKLITLPIFYSLVCDISGVAEFPLLFRITPLVVQTVHYMLVYRFAALLAGHKKERRARYMFLYMVILLVGDYVEQTFSFGIVHEAWEGKTIMQGLMLLMIFLMLYRVYRGEDRLFGAVGALVSLAAVFSVVPVSLSGVVSLPLIIVNNEWKILVLSVVAVYILRARNNLRWKKHEKLFLWVVLPVSVIYAGAPVVLALAFTSEQILAIAESRNRGTLAFAGIVFLGFLTGNIIPHRCPATLYSTIDSDTKALICWIRDYASEMNGISLVAPPEIMEYARLESSGVKLPYGKDLWHSNCNFEVGDAYDSDVARLYDHIRISELQPDSAAAVAGSMGIQVMILRAPVPEDMLSMYNYAQAETLGVYHVYVR